MNRSRRILDFARKNRRTATLAEKVLWQNLRNRKLNELKFKRQVVIQSQFILDFYCHAVKLGIEVDGPYHNNEEQRVLDESRSEELRRLGIHILRFSNEEILHQINDVLLSILNEIDAIKNARFDSTED